MLIIQSALNIGDTSHPHPRATCFKPKHRNCYKIWSWLIGHGQPRVVICAETVITAHNSTLNVTHKLLLLPLLSTSNWPSYLQGSCAGLEFKTSLEKSLNFIKLKKSLNCFVKQLEDLDKFGICLCETFNKTWWLWELPATVPIKRVEELP